ncbi:MAG: GGDEF domain-containing protein [Acidobacteriota bacterium]
MRTLVLIAIILAVAFAGDRWQAELLPGAATLLWTARAALAATFLLAWRFHRGRLATAAFLLASCTEVVALSAALPEGLLRSAVAFLLPLNLALLSIVGEWRILSLGGLLRLGVVALQGAAVTALHRGHAPQAADWLQRSWVDLQTGVAMPQTALFAFASAAALLLLRLILRRTALEAGLLGALGATFLAFELTTRPLLFLTAGGLVLLLSQIENLFALAFADGLTGLPSRRALDERLRQLGRRYAIAMVDIDHFKRLNDRHGHEVGDQVLRRIAGRLAKVKGGGTAYRYGGEEFTILFPGKSAAAVEAHLGDLRRSIAEAPFIVRGAQRGTKAHRKARSRRGQGNGKKSLKVTGKKSLKVTGKKSLKVTVSIGVADRHEKRKQVDDVLKAADRALYKAKRAGRNRVVKA